MLFQRHVFALILLLSGTSYASAQEAPALPPLTVTIDWQDTRQTLHGFGASDAWGVQYAGTWPDPKRQQIADLLFSRALDDGQPRGIGLSVWRFNIGAGSAAQGASSGIRDSWRRAEGFLTDAGTYDWSRQAGQQWFLRAARERGVPIFIAFTNSPPVQLTQNGKAHGDGGMYANLAEDRYDDFAQFLVTVLQHFDDEGVPFDYISPVNEPQWDWGPSNNQEGSPYQNEEIAGVVNALSRRLDGSGLPTQIEIPEAAQLNFLYTSDADRPGRDEQIEAFFGPESSLRELPAVAYKVAAHSYFTTWPIADMIRHRTQLAERLQAVDPGLEFWMSEYCVLENNAEIRGGGRDLGMDPALYVARVIHHDLTLAHAASWQWWLAVSPYDYKDGLVYIDKNPDDGRVYDSKLLWALGNYSLFLQPGAIRLGTTRSDHASEREQARGLMTSAYRSANGDAVIVVAVNYGTTDAPAHLHVDGLSHERSVQHWQPYITSATQDLAPGERLAPDAAVMVPARTIVTFVGAL